MECEIHSGGAENLAVCAASANALWFERGLLHPFLDYDICPEYLHTRVDPMDGEGFVHLSRAPGLGQDINWDWIEAHTIETR